jgi:hypothetical protein
MSNSKRPTPASRSKLASRKASPKGSTQSPPKNGSKLASLKKMIFRGGETPKAAGAKAAPKKTVPTPAPKQAKAAVAAPQHPSKAKAPAVASSKTAPAQKQPAVVAAAAPQVAAPAKPAKAASTRAPRGGTPLSKLQAAAAASSKKLAAAALGKTLVSDGSETVCREVACEGLATTTGYCRLHYIKNWKKIKRKELILKEGKLNQYIEELVAKYPDKYIEAIRQDLMADKDFAKVIHDLDLDESVDEFEMEGESVDSLIDSIKRDFDDEGGGADY